MEKLEEYTKKFIEKYGEKLNDDTIDFINECNEAIIGAYNHDAIDDLINDWSLSAADCACIYYADIEKILDNASYEEIDAAFQELKSNAKDFESLKSSMAFEIKRNEVIENIWDDINMLDSYQLNFKI